eukprot:766985-Hanusia_phi.AAC.4
MQLTEVAFFRSAYLAIQSSSVRVPMNLAMLDQLGSVSREDEHCDITDPLNLRETLQQLV